MVLDMEVFMKHSDFFKYVQFNATDYDLCDYQYLNMTDMFFQFFKAVNCDLEIGLRLVENIEPDEKFIQLRNESLILTPYHFVQMLFEFKERITFFVCSDYKNIEYRKTHPVDRRMEQLRSFWQVYKTPEEYPVFDATDAIVRI